MPAGRAGDVERVEDDRLDAGGAEQLLGLGVAEREGPSTGDGDHGSAAARAGPVGVAEGRRGVPRRGLELRCRAGDGEHVVEVDVLRHALGEQRDGLDRPVPLGGRHEPEVPRRRLDAGVPGEHAEHGYACRLERRPHLAHVAPGRGLVEDDAGDADPGLEGGEAVHDRGGRASHVADVEGQHDGGARQRRDVRGGGVAVAADPPVEEAHDALDDGDVARAVRGGAVHEQRRDERLACEERVEVAPRSAGREGVVARVDEVGADLEARHRQPARPERCHEARGDGRLAVAGPGGGHDEARQHRAPAAPAPPRRSGAAGRGRRRSHCRRRSPLDPPLALLAGIEGVLDLRHLRHEVGEVEHRLRAAAPGDHDVLVSGAVTEGRDDVVDVDPAPRHRVGELVEHVDAVRLGGEPALDLGPALAGRVGVVVVGALLAGPRPAGRPSCATPSGRRARSPGAARRGSRRRSARRCATSRS